MYLAVDELVRVWRHLGDTGKERGEGAEQFCALAPRRISQKSRPRNSSVGRKLSSMFSHHGRLVCSGLALTTTCWMKNGPYGTRTRDGPRLSSFSRVRAARARRRSRRTALGG